MIHSTRAHDDAVNSLSYLESGLVVSGGEDGLLLVWDNAFTDKPQNFIIIDIESQVKINNFIY